MNIRIYFTQGGSFALAEAPNLEKAFLEIKRLQKELTEEDDGETDLPIDLSGTWWWLTRVKVGHPHPSFYDAKDLTLFNDSAWKTGDEFVVWACWRDTESVAVLRVVD